MTEDEAKTKWCPFSRYIHGDSPAANRWKQSLPEHEPHAMNPIPCRCIASACMAWRRVVVVDPDNRGPHEMPLPMWHPTEGFCGLAGKLS